MRHINYDHTIETRRFRIIQAILGEPGIHDVKSLGTFDTLTDAVDYGIKYLSLVDYVYWAIVDRYTKSVTKWDDLVIA